MILSNARTAALVALLAAAANSALADPRESPIEAPGPLAPLRGTLLAPAPAAPVVLIIPGSGPTNRDGNNRLGVNASTYRLLAEGLAAKGIASVRIDKRGMFASTAAVADPNDVTIEDYAADVRSWVGTLRSETGASCIWVAGHSEGGLVALAAGRDEGVCGLILIATAGRPMGQVLRDQLKANPASAPLLDQAFSAIDSLEAGRGVDTASLRPVLQSLFSPAVQRFLISDFAIDPARLIAAYKKPVLILQGERDIQISVADARRLHQAAPGSTLVLLNNANHVLKAVESEDRAANLATYRDPDKPLAPGIIEAIATFLATSAIGH